MNEIVIDEATAVTFREEKRVTNLILLQANGWVLTISLPSTYNSNGCTFNPFLIIVHSFCYIPVDFY